MLLRANRTSLYVDFWSLDVEGFEMTVLGAIDFEKILVDSILVEDFWIANRPLDRLLIIDDDEVFLERLPCSSNIPLDPERDAAAVKDQRSVTADKVAGD